MSAKADGIPGTQGRIVIIEAKRSHCGRPHEELYVNTGYLASRRVPWYAQEKRAPAPYVCTYMGRTSNGRKPFRFLWNQSAALASNLYLWLFPKGPLQAALRNDPQLFRAVLEALPEIDTAAFIREGRVYGGGLYKMESVEKRCQDCQDPLSPRCFRREPSPI